MIFHLFKKYILNSSYGTGSGLPGDSVGKESIYFLVGKIPWRRAWQPTPVFLPGAGYIHRVAKELDMTEAHTPACMLQLCPRHTVNNAVPVWYRFTDLWVCR